MVRQRSDRLQGLISPGALPVQLELGSVEGRPFSNEPQCTVGHRAGKNLERLDGNRCLLARVTSVEMGYAVLHVVHSDDDSIENSLIRGMLGFQHAGVSSPAQDVRSGQLSAQTPKTDRGDFAPWVADTAPAAAKRNRRT